MLGVATEKASQVDDVKNCLGMFDNIRLARCLITPESSQLA